MARHVSGGGGGSDAGVMTIDSNIVICDDRGFEWHLQVEKVMLRGEQQFIPGELFLQMSDFCKVSKSFHVFTFSMLSQEFLSWHPDSQEC